MARKRPVMPSIAKIMQMEGIGSNSAERGILAASRALDANLPSVTSTMTSSTGGLLTARERARRAMTHETAMAIQAAKAGDDTELLPYQPTPSINPPRPRTLAAGYDRDTQVMRVRFREGVGYNYYGVSPREWNNFKRVKSPGRAINRTFNYKQYSREAW